MIQLKISTIENEMLFFDFTVARNIEESKRILQITKVDPQLLLELLQKHF